MIKIIMIVGVIVVVILHVIHLLLCCLWYWCRNARWDESDGQNVDGNVRKKSFWEVKSGRNILIQPREIYTNLVWILESRKVMKSNVDIWRYSSQIWKGKSVKIESFKKDDEHLLSWSFFSGPSYTFFQVCFSDPKKRSSFAQ